MATFSNGEEGLLYQERYCHHCHYWNAADEKRLGFEVGCPIWALHELYVGEPEWQPTLDRLIPMVPTMMNGIAHRVAGQCTTWWEKPA